MIIAFCGHADYIKHEPHEQILLDILQTEIGNNPVELFFGGYGSFDTFALQCGIKYRRMHPNTKLILVTPYLSKASFCYMKNNKTTYDTVLYPPLENIPPKYAIVHRNRWIVEQADLIIAYVNHPWGGAFTTLQHAKKKEKRIFNLASVSTFQQET